MLFQCAGKRVCDIARSFRLALLDNLTAARYLDIEERYIFCTEERYVIDPEQAIKAVDENTIGICAILGSTYTGEYEDVKAINDLLVKKNIDCGIHVDAASGGFVAPFLNPDLQWDFRLEKVISINVSGHKYGLVRNISARSTNSGSLITNERSTRVSAGSFGDPTSTFHKSLFSTSTIWVRISLHSHSTSRRARRLSSANTTR